MGLTRLAIYRPIIAVTLIVATVLFGLIAFRALGLEDAPTIKLPIVTVQIIYTGASAETVEQQVTQRVEDAIATLSDIDTLTSNSSDGLAVLTVEFKEHVNVDVAATDVQQKVQSVRKDLPAEIEEPTYLKVDLNDVPILYLALTNDGDASAVDSYRVADELVRRRIEQVDGVGRVLVAGGREPEVQVRVAPDRLRAYGLGYADVTDALKAQYVTAAGGDVRTAPDAGGRATGLRVESRQTSVADLGALPIVTRDGFSTELRNVADVYLDGKEPEQYVRLNGQNAVGLLVYKQTGANITQTADAVLPVVDELRQELPGGYDLQVALDPTISIRSSVEDMERELVIAAVLAGLVLLLFLHTPRATLMVLLAIPTSLVVAFIAMKAFGLSLNTMTLIGLTTSIGILVDDSIVVLENIFSHLERGEEPKAAALAGRSEIGMAAIAITLIDVAVYGPILFVTGITGAYIRNFALVIVVATLASLLVSFTLTPLLASRWLSLSDQRSLIARLASAWEPGYHWLERRYTALLDWSLHHRPVIVAVGVLTLFASLRIVPLLGSEFVPEPDQRIVYVTGELPGGTTLDGTDRAARRWEAALLDRDAFPDIQQVYTVVGRGDTDSDLATRFISIALEVGRRGERHRDSKEIRRAAADAGEALVPGLRAHVGGARGGGVGQQLQIRLYGNDLGDLTRWATRAQVALADRPELQDVTQSSVSAPETVVRPDPQRVKDFGLTVQTVAGAVRAAYEGTVAARYVEQGGKERDIRVRLPEALRYDQQGVGELPLAVRGSSLITVQQVADLKARQKPVRILRVNRDRAVQIAAEPRGVALGAAKTIATAELDQLGLPAGMHWEFAGQGKEQQKSFAALGVALGVAIVLEYLVLIILYESLITPLVILSALPLSLVGAFGGLYVFQNTLSVPSFIGIIALAGLVGKNSILLVDRIGHLRREGMARDAAIREAGPHRLRPILMTSLTLVAGLLPVAMKLGEGGELRAPLAAVIVGGMTTSTLLSLVFVPVSYTYFDALQHLPARIMAAVRGRLARGAHGSPAAAPEPATTGGVAAADLAATVTVAQAGAAPTRRAPAPKLVTTGTAAAVGREPASADRPAIGAPGRFGGAAPAPMAGSALPLTAEAAADYLAGVARCAQGQPAPAGTRLDWIARRPTPESC
ncbi:MAG TPA: efflux RND transporter permease subunit [Chloroflexota bacterium]